MVFPQIVRTEFRAARAKGSGWCGENKNTGTDSQVEKLGGRKMVGPGGLEPLTSSVSRKRSNQLSYGPLAYGAKFLLQAIRLQNSNCLQGQSATVSRWRSNQLSYEPSVSESISQPASILPHVQHGAQFGSHPVGFQQSLKWQALAAALRAGCVRNASTCVPLCSQTTQESETRQQ